MKRIKISLGSRSYNILIGRGVLSRLGEYLKVLNIGEDAVIITNRTINNLYGFRLKRVLKESGFSTKIDEVPDSEESKSQKIALSLINRIANYDLRKRLFIIAFGGGVIGDLSGFIASIYKRGIPYIQIPTTLLAQVDSAIGGKTAIDLTGGKNLVGAFYQPRLVLSDIDFLSSLSRSQMVSGLAEVIKYAVIKDSVLFHYLKKEYKNILSFKKVPLEYTVYKCAQIKARIVEQDEKEIKGKRTILNYGHSIGHAIEAASGYKGYSHGQAIAIGMVIAAEISYKLNILDKKSFQEIKELIKALGLPTKAKSVSLSSMVKALYHDKKFIHGKNRFVLPKKIGEVIICEDIPTELIEETLRGKKSIGI
ncbi:MAG: 3-dehydroquinate synthase [Candidatus Omnitrophota bacterium]